MPSPFLTIHTATPISSTTNIASMVLVTHQSLQYSWDKMEIHLSLFLVVLVLAIEVSYRSFKYFDQFFTRVINGNVRKISVSIN